MIIRITEINSEMNLNIMNLIQQLTIVFIYDHAIDVLIYMCLVIIVSKNYGSFYRKVSEENIVKNLKLSHK